MKKAQYSEYGSSPAAVRVARATGLVATFLLSATATFALTMNAVLNNTFHSARLAVVLLALIAFHFMRFPKFLWSREFVLYALFFSYMLVELFWTSDRTMAMNTLMPALDFILILILFSAISAYHDLDATLQGMLFGFVAGAGIYSVQTGFPFAYPAEFSYNAVALMYLFGLFLALLLACVKHSKSLYLVVAIIFLGHIVATTSIKTNLGLVLGGMVGGIFYFRQSAKLLRRNVLLLLLLLAAFTYFAASNDTLMNSLERGANRVALGIEVLQAREDLPGYTGFASRDRWQAEALAGWAANPVFGNGVESFRSRTGITSHSTPIDLLHNSGLIGLCLFYSMLGLLAWRIVRTPVEIGGNIGLLTLSILVCFIFISLSGNVHYNAFLAAFIASSTAVLKRVASLGREA